MDRPVLSKLLKELKDGDCFYVTRLDRFARTTLEALKVIASLDEQNIKFYSLDLPTNGDKAMQEMFLFIILWFARFENEQRKRRQAEGIALAKQANKYKGRKSKITPKLMNDLKNYLYTRNYLKKDAAKALNISRATLYKALKLMEKEEKKI